MTARKAKNGCVTPTISHLRREKAKRSAQDQTIALSVHPSPLLFQTNASREMRFRPGGFTNRSPTDSLESRFNWAYKQCCILNEQHRTHPPTHEAVIKFIDKAPVNEIRRFNKSLREKLAYWVKTSRVEFAVFFVIEIERNNCVHYHLLIRTAIKFPRMVLGKIVTKASQGKSRLQHCEKIENVEAFTRYIVKDTSEVRTGQKKVLLFKRGLRLRQCGAWNRYFVKPKKELWKQSKLSRYPVGQKRDQSE